MSGKRAFKGLKDHVPSYMYELNQRENERKGVESDLWYKMDVKKPQNFHISISSPKIEKPGLDNGYSHRE